MKISIYIFSVFISRQKAFYSLRSLHLSQIFLYKFVNRAVFVRHTRKKNNNEQLQTVGSVQTKIATRTFANNSFNPDILQTR